MNVPQARARALAGDDDLVHRGVGRSSGFLRLIRSARERQQCR
jgi:hypothetical protein